MRILQVAPLYGSITPEMTYGSIERVAAATAAALGEAGHEVMLCADQNSEVDVPLLGVANDPPFAYGAQAEVIMPLIEGGEVDVVHAHNAHSLGALVAAGAAGNVLLVASSHGPAEQSSRGYVPLIDPKRGVHLLALSRFQAQAFGPYCEISGVAPNGVDPTLYKPSPDDQVGDYAMTLGRVGHEKGIDRAIKAARLVGVPLLIVGPVLPSEQDFFESAIRPHLHPGEVEYHGPASDAEKVPLLQGAKVVMQLSRVDETSSLTVLEALACGTPVVATSRGSLGEMIINGVTGFTRDDNKTIAAALVEAQALDRVQVRERTLEGFSWAATARRLADIYERIA